MLPQSTEQYRNAFLSGCVIAASPFIDFRKQPDVRPAEGGEGIMVSEHTGPKAETGSPLDNLSERDLNLGRKSARFLRNSCMVAFLVCFGIALYVAFNVPWETRMPYEGQYGRNGIPMPIAMLPVLVSLGIFWRTGGKQAGCPCHGSRLRSAALNRSAGWSCRSWQQWYSPVPFWAVGHMEAIRVAGGVSCR